MFFRLIVILFLVQTSLWSNNREVGFVKREIKLRHSAVYVEIDDGYLFYELTSWQHQHEVDFTGLGYKPSEYRAEIIDWSILPDTNRPGVIYGRFSHIPISGVARGFAKLFEADNNESGLRMLFFRDKDTLYKFLEEDKFVNVLALQVTDTQAKAVMDILDESVNAASPYFVKAYTAFETNCSILLILALRAIGIPDKQRGMWPFSVLPDAIFDRAVEVISVGDVLVRKNTVQRFLN